MVKFTVVYAWTMVIGLLNIVLLLVWQLLFKGGYSWHSNIKLQFNFHPFLMSLGFVFLSANSLLIYRGLRKVKKQYLKALHIGIHVVVLSCITIALIAVFDFHNLSTPPKPNLYSMHSWLGIITITLYLIQFATAFVLYSYPGASFNLRIKSIKYHVFFGLLVFVSGIITAFSGFSEITLLSLHKRYQDLPGEGILLNIIALLHCLFAALVVYMLTQQEFQRRPCSDDGVAIKAYPLSNTQPPLRNS